MHVELNPYEHFANPMVTESIVRSAKATITLAKAGVEVFEFRNAEDGTHYVTNRATALRCMSFDHLVAYTSPRMFHALAQPTWSEPGRA